MSILMVMVTGVQEDNPDGGETGVRKWSWRYQAGKDPSYLFGLPRKWNNAIHEPQVPSEQKEFCVLLMLYLPRTSAELPRASLMR